MTRNFHRWQVDPFFAAAEEVQDSADRLESVYRTWMHLKSADSCPDEDPEIEFHRRELSISLGTAKWQLEEFERASSFMVIDDQQCAGDDASARHRQFIDALWNQINTIERSLLISADGRDLKVIPAVVLNEGQKDELALFLCGSRESSLDNSKKVEHFPCMDQKAYEEAQCMNSESMESKTSSSDYFLSSATNSETTSNKMDCQKCLPSQRSFLSQEHPVLQHKNGMPGQLEIKIEQVDQPSVDPIPEHFYGKDEKLKRVNEHGSSASLLENISSRESNLTEKGTGKLQRNAVTRSSLWNLNLFSFFAKYRHPFSAKFSRSCLKQCKDGDANASEYRVSVYGSSGAGKVFGNLRERNSNLVYANTIVGGARYDNNYSMAHSEVSELSTWLQHGLSSRQTLQISSGILVMLGILGFSFHVYYI